MQQLKPFEMTDSPIAVSADLHIRAQRFSFEYVVTDAGDLVSVPKDSFELASAKRQDGLWQTTCFEAFIRPMTGKAYYEMNFSFDGLWNAYKFDDYRSPAKLVPTDDFRVIAMKWDAVRFKFSVEVESSKPLGDLAVSLTTVVAEKTGHKHYFALNHAGSKPDFHLAESFTLRKVSSK
ncbi:MAG: hypothetical protein EOP06_20650 [Proteobacteria bacterium]|nr:MAG: hypothetical protein EOP06_20650 [Pseudomonadota bacterium]